MKSLSLIVLLILTSCGHKEKSAEPKAPVIPRVQVSDAEPKKETHNLLIGTYTTEYFADRLLLKAKNAQISPIFKKEHQAKYQVFLGPFNSKEEALATFKQMKQVVPSLPKPLFYKP